MDTPDQIKEIQYNDIHGWPETFEDKIKKEMKLIEPSEVQVEMERLDLLDDFFVDLLELTPEDGYEKARDIEVAIYSIKHQLAKRNLEDRGIY